MKSVQQMYPFFDDNALDAARFFFGNPETEVTFFEGNTTLTAFIEEESAEREFGLPIGSCLCINTLRTMS